MSLFNPSTDRCKSPDTVKQPSPGENLDRVRAVGIWESTVNSKESAVYSVTFNAIKLKFRGVHVAAPCAFNQMVLASKQRGETSTLMQKWRVICARFSCEEEAAWQGLQMLTNLFAVSLHNAAAKNMVQFPRFFPKADHFLFFFLPLSFRFFLSVFLQVT